MKNFIFRNKSLLQFIFVCFVVTLVFTINFLDYGDDKIREIDEGAWIYSSYYYHLAFQKKDLASPDWKDFDAIDHPPIAKYIYGYYLSLINQVPKSIKYKTWWFETQDLYKVQKKSFSKALRKKVSKESLKVGRMVSSMFVVMMIVITYVILSYYTPFWINLVAVFGMSYHHLLLGRSVQVISDSIYIFLMMLFGFLSLKWTEFICEKSSKNSIYYSIVLGIVLGLMFMTKISGLLGFLTISFYCFILLFFLKVYPQINFKKLFLHWIIILIAFLFTTYISNPSLYNEPIQFLVKMFEHRINRVADQQNIYFTSSYPTLWLSISYFFKKIFMTYDPIFQLTYFPFYLFSFIFGIISFILKAKENSKYLLLLVLVFCFTGATAYTLKMNWERYLLPSLPWVFILICFGLNYLYSLKSLFPRKMYQPILVAILSICILKSVNFLNMDFFLKNNPTWKNERRIQKTLYYLKIDPDNLELLEKLKKYYKRLHYQQKYFELKQNINGIKAQR